MEAKNKDIVTIPEKQEVTSIQMALMKIVENPNIDPERLEKFLDLQVKMEDRQAKIAFSEALAGFQAECPIIPKTKKVNFSSKSGNTTKYDYSPLDETAFIIKPILQKWGLSYSFSEKLTADKDKNELIVRIRHKAGYAEDFPHYYHSVHDDDRMNLSQRGKSALTYAKRAGLENALGIHTTGEDDDARRTANVDITPEEIKEVRSLIDSTGADPERLFLYLGVENKKIEELSGADAKRAIHALKQKKQKMEAL